MLKITIPADEGFDESKNLFLVLPEVTLQLEHSLVSMSKWESKWKKPFLDKKDKTKEETIDYIRQMTITQNVDDSVYLRINKKHMADIRDYIDDSMSATTFSEIREKKTNSEVITSEVIYYWMVAFNIPFECQKWHLNRLITLIRVCNIKNQKPRKMSRREAAKNQRALNEARRAKLGTTG